MKRLPIFLITLSLHTSSFCMDDNYYQGIGPLYEKIRKKNIKDLAVKCKTEVFPKTGELSKNKSSNSFSIDTVYKSKNENIPALWCIFSKNLKYETYNLGKLDAYCIAYSKKKANIGCITKESLDKHEYLREVWEHLKKTLEEKLQKRKKK